MTVEATSELFWISLAMKMLLTAGFVVAASVVAERAGPVIGGLVSSLPFSGGPAYVFIALDHDAAFVAQAALTSLAAHAVTTYYALTYVKLARGHGLALSLGVAFLVWAALTWSAHTVSWTTLSVIALNGVSFAICLPLLQRDRRARMPRTERRWFDIPLRALLVATLIGIIVLFSGRVGPHLTGIVAMFPVIFTSLMIILHPRMGGPAAAAVIANASFGMLGYAMALITLHVLAVPLGSAGALALAAIISVAWNGGLWLLFSSRLGARLAALRSR